MNGLSKQLVTSLTLFVMALSLNSHAASIVAAERAFQQQDYAKALDELSPLVRDGDAEALYLLGVMTRDGQGVKADTTEAQRLFESAARQGHLESVNALRAIKNEAYKTEFDQTLPQAKADSAVAQNRIGEMYEFGQGVERNLSESYKWFNLAAQQGYVAGIHNLARAYNFGSGTAIDYKRAEALYLESASKGYADSMFFLGTLYATRNGNDQSVDSDHLAYAWMNAASERGNTTATVIKNRLLMKLDDQGRETAQALAETFVNKYVNPFK